MSDKVVHVFIVGSKGIPAKYGGFETFVENLTARRQNRQILYHVSCMNNDEKHFEYNGADCFNIRVPMRGAPGRIIHVGLVLKAVERWIRDTQGQEVIVLILGCRIGPLLIPHARKLHKLGAKILCNPDGLEWKRSKWSKPAKRFLRYCEKCLVLNSDYIICDSRAIEQYIRETYGVRETAYIAYGAQVGRSKCSEEKIRQWMDSYQIKAYEYYLIVGRFVPENNYETMIREFMRSSTKKDLVIVTNVEKDAFYKRLRASTGFDQDPRIKFVGTVYDQELLTRIREMAYGYLHGHEVGGTNPSLLEALASTRINLLLDVGFNREVGKDGALYWDKEKDGLSDLIDRADRLSEDEIRKLHATGMDRIRLDYSWEEICRKYEEAFLLYAEKEADA